MVQKILAGLAALVFGVWAFNTSLFTGPPEDSATRILSHRGVHQTYSRENLGRDDCTATRMYQPTHNFLENTLGSMEAAFEAGADVVELDVHQTADGYWAVFHDWTLDCRTDGAGETRKASRAELEALDIGYGYTADGGASFPFRGQGVGLMPMLDDVFAAFPEAHFLVNLKSNSTDDGEAFGAYIQARPEWRANIYGFYGGPRAVAGAQAAFASINGFSSQQAKICLKKYVLWGWSGHMPAACRNTQVLIPINYARFLWGWPHKLTARMEAVGSDVVLAGPYGQSRWGSGGIDTPEMAALVPVNFDGFIWTNKTEEIAPFLENRW